MHALIIEDEALIAMAIEEALQSCGFTSFEIAVSAQEAVESAARKCPDLITADVELRPGCGIDAVQSICSGTTIPIVFITGTPAKVRIRMPGHVMVEKPFNAHHIAQATKLVLECKDG